MSWRRKLYASLNRVWRELPDLSVELAGIRLRNPVIAASGTFGYGEEFERFVDLQRIGGICVKGTSARPIDGNLPPRLFPTPSGMLNSIGLENVGVDAFIRDKMPFLRDAGCAVFVNVFGFTRGRVRRSRRQAQPLRRHRRLRAEHLVPEHRTGGMVFGQNPAIPNT